MGLGGSKPEQANAPMSNVGATAPMMNNSRRNNGANRNNRRNNRVANLEAPVVGNVGANAPVMSNTGPNLERGNNNRRNRANSGNSVAENVRIQMNMNANGAKAPVMPGNVASEPGVGMAGGRRRKGSRKGSRKNRKASRKNRKASRKNRK